MTERIVVLTLLLVAAATVPLSAQVGTTSPLRLGDALLNLPTARTLPPGIWDLRFTHRFAQPINQGDVHSLWGLDGAADIGIGLAYAPRENFQLALFRSDVLDNLEISAKSALVMQSATRPVTIGARGGVNWKTERGLDDRLTPFAQIIVSRRISDRVELFAVPSWAGRTAFHDSAFNLPLGAAYAIRPHLLLIGEVIPENRDAPDELNPGLAWSVGLKRAVGGHFFEVLLTDSRATHVDQYVGSVPPGGIREGDVHLGFNIGRRFGTSR